MNEIHRHNSDIVNYSSSLRAKEDDLNDVCFESSEPVVVNHGQGSQDSNNVKTKVEPSSMHRETVASTVRVVPVSSKSSGGSSNPMSIQLKAKSIYVKKEIPEEDWIWTIILGCQKCKRDSFETRISKCVTNMVRHHDLTKTNEKQMERRTGMFYSQYWKEDSEINLTKSSRTRIGSIAFILQASRQSLKSARMKKRKMKIYSCDPGSLRWSDHITKIDTLRDDSLQMESVHLSRGSSTRPMLHSRNWIGGRRIGT